MTKEALEILCVHVPYFLQAWSHFNYNFLHFILFNFKVQEMYFAKPPVEPDLKFCKEVFQTLIKYNDR